MTKTTLKHRTILIFLGIFLSFIILEAGMRLSAFVLLKIQESQNAISPGSQDVYRILCLGESTTALGGQRSYPSQLEEILNSKSATVKFKVMNQGMCNTNSSAIVAHVNSNLDKYTPDMVLVMMGINDRMVGRSLENEARTPFYASFKTYKLLKFLRIHLEDIISKKLVGGRKGNNAMTGNVGNPIEDDQGRPQKELNDTDASFRQGMLYLENGFLDQAETLLRDIVQKIPDHEMAIFYLGKISQERGLNQQAQDFFARVLEINPLNVEVYIQLARLYSQHHPNYATNEEMYQQAQQRYQKAAAMYHKALEIDPGNPQASLRLAEVYYKKLYHHDRAESVLRGFIRDHPNAPQGYTVLGNCFKAQNKYSEAVEMFAKSLEINPENIFTRLQLAEAYMDSGDGINAIDVLKGIIEDDPKNDKAHALLAKIYQDMGLFTTAEEFFKKADALRSRYYLPKTRHNYQRLYKELNQRGVKMVCVQYPVRSIMPLKKIFYDAPGVIFVDNEKIFKQALRQESYEKYFLDYFAGDFGHCTPKGNRLLAKNIADTILRHLALE